MKPGTVVFHRDFTFNDGGVSDKLFIILNGGTNNKPYLILLTTSKSRGFRLSIEGCHSEKYLELVKQFLIF